MRNSLNVGFSAGVDVGALHARGEFLLLLNSDVFVEPGWLPPLLAALDRSPSLAGVSPVLLNIDGSVQEAGSLLFAGGVTRAVTSADRWALDFSRTVPYVSAACLLLRRSVFTKLGGLDCVYGLGYYEDVELAMELDHLGLSLGYVAGSARARGVFEPRACDAPHGAQPCDLRPPLAESARRAPSCDRSPDGERRSACS